MKRAECIKALYGEFEESLVVTIMGACAQELYDLGHRENFFYLQHAMGLASSIGLGLALSLPKERVVVLDGDGSVLMNLGTLTTIARYRPANLVHIQRGVSGNRLAHPPALLGRNRPYQLPVRSHYLGCSISDVGIGHVAIARKMVDATGLPIGNQTNQSDRGSHGDG